MSTDKPPKTLKRIKTGQVERRLSLASAGVVAGTRAATHLWLNVFTPKDKRLQKRRQMIARQAQYLADELGKLKGSVVKIGQVMALYGEHILPPEATAALRSLEEQTVAIDWPVMEQVLLQELGAEQLALLDIDTRALAAASLGQVHRARRKSDGRQLCLKIQYPGVADAIDSDLDAVASLLRWTKLITAGNDFEDWLAEIRDMLKREVDYLQEAATTRHFAQLLAADKRFIVPEIIDPFSSDRVMCMSFEAGHVVSSTTVSALPRQRRNALGQAFLDLFLHEIFDWSELQTDPNFGNYRIRPKSKKSEVDQIVLLDFGAVRKFPATFIEPVKDIIKAACEHDIQRIITGAITLKMIKADYPEPVKESFAQLCIGLVEPLNYDREQLPAAALNRQGAYRWAHSNLPRRIARQATQAAYSKYFAIPPREFTFLSRKLLGVYNFIAALDAEFDGRTSLAAYMES